MAIIVKSPVRTSSSTPDLNLNTEHAVRDLEIVGSWDVEGFQTMRGPCDGFPVGAVVDLQLIRLGVVDHQALQSRGGVGGEGRTLGRGHPRGKKSTGLRSDLKRRSRTRRADPHLSGGGDEDGGLTLPVIHEAAAILVVPVGAGRAGKLIHPVDPPLACHQQPMGRQGGAAGLPGGPRVAPIATDSLARSSL